MKWNEIDGEIQTATENIQAVKTLLERFIDDTSSIEFTEALTEVDYVVHKPIGDFLAVLPLVLRGTEESMEALQEATEIGLGQKQVAVKV